MFNLLKQELGLIVDHIEIRISDHYVQRLCEPAKQDRHDGMLQPHLICEPVGDVHRKLVRFIVWSNHFAGNRARIESCEEQVGL